MAEKKLPVDSQVVAATLDILRTDSQLIYNRHQEIMDFLDEKGRTEIQFLKDWVGQIANGKQTGPLMPKTPKAMSKRVQRIKTIPEDEVMDNSDMEQAVMKRNETEIPEIFEASEEEEAKPVRSRRAASQRATESIKKQQSLSAATKLRRNSDNQVVICDMKPSQTIHLSRSKRPKHSFSGSDEDDRPPLKVSKTSLKPDTKKRGRGKKIKQESTSDGSPEKAMSVVEAPLPTPAKESAVPALNSPISDPLIAHQNRSNSLKNTTITQPSQRAPIIDETVSIQDATMTEPSMYEDAIGKSIPMNSTMNPNTTITIDRKMMNATVVIEKMMNETVTLKKSSITTSLSLQENLRNEISPVSPIPEPQSKQRLQSKLMALKESFANQEFNGFLTDDESSPERKATFKKPMNITKTLKSAKSSSSDDEEETPVKKLTEFNKYQKSSASSEDDDEDLAKTAQYKSKGYREIINKYKTNTIFSPYAKESVKKKVEAFEQAVQNSPKTEIDAPRLTRTKTRALAAAKQTPTILTGKLARKSLAKAKKISMSRSKREHEEGKENLLASATKVKYLGTNDKVPAKQNQRTTPVSKTRLLMPMSVSRIHNTPASQIPPPKVMTASKAMHTSSDSLTSSKPLSKSGSTDSLVEKKRMIVDEDARRKKEEALRALTEEKKRKREEKELKNKLAREAKEKLKQERRLKIEKEREEKAKQAQLAQEKLKEETEKKKLAQLQRAQEKEEKRRQEEQMRLEKIREQEETERQLAEQKRKEQEADRKRLIEARNQQIAELENAKLKVQLMAKAKQMQISKEQGPQAYILDSDPDDDESEDESKPKHTIPHWARAEVRKVQLDMQQYIPMDLVLDFFGAKKSTPNLAELFVGIKKDRLKRTSSANWKTPPRFSMMED